MKNWKGLSLIAFLCLGLQFSGCTPESAKILTDILSATAEQPLTQAEIISGLKEALIQGAVKGSSTVSALDGYYKNPSIKILFPPEAQKVEKTLQDIGMGSLTEQLVEKVNRAAEDAAKEAAPIFREAIVSMTISDAMDILMGQDIFAKRLIVAFTTLLNPSSSST